MVWKIYTLQGNNSYILKFLPYQGKNSIQINYTTTMKAKTHKHL